MELPVLNPEKNILGSGCASSGCGTATASQGSNPPDALRERVASHPCFSEQAHHHFARMHVAVAPACNIQCNYCNRKYDCSNESRPGVVSEVLSPDQAVRKVKAVAAAIPQLSVLGIAGPGDPLANPQRTFETFRRLAQETPDIKLCVSTNGLNLPEWVEEISRYNIEHVTITINCVDPQIGARIYPWIFWQNRRIRGVEAARILIEQQQQGLEMLVARDILVKVNSVLIPGINAAHLQEVSRIVKAKGAFLHNVMPIIARPEHGTYFGLTGQREPTHTELETLQNACADGDMKMMRHCRQCRADAVGMLGEDRGGEFTLDQLTEQEVDYEAAMVQRAAVQSQLLAQLQAQQTRIQPETVQPASRAVKMAVATQGSGLINQHFGHATEFLVYEAGPVGVRFVGHRQVDKPYCEGGSSCGDEGESVLNAIIRQLQDCEVLLCARVGYEPWGALESAGIQPNGEHAMEPIETAVLAVYQQMQEKELLDQPQPRLERA